MAKFYLYHLIDPRTNEVFYVGKGKNGRMYQHEREARKGEAGPKCDRIREIWASGGEVLKDQIAWFDNEAEAYAREEGEIARIGLGTLTNISSGRVGSPASPLPKDTAKVRERFLVQMAGWPQFHRLVRQWAGWTDNGRNRIVAIRGQGFRASVLRILAEKLPGDLSAMTQIPEALARLAQGRITLVTQYTKGN